MSERRHERQVDVESINLRLDQFLTKQPEISSRAFAQRLITEGHVSVNNKKSNKHYHLKEGDRVFFKIPAAFGKVLIPETLPLDVRYEDKDLLILSKQPHMVVHPVSPAQKGTLVHALLAYSKNFVKMTGHEADETLRPGIVHRLDKNTSGLMIVAKHEQSKLALVRAIKNREVRRGYLALVHGLVEMDSGTIDVPLGKGYRDRTRVTIAGRASRKAVTHFKVKKRFDKYTLLQIDLETGRTHQIRVHLRYIGHPVVGDQEYGYKNKKRESRGELELDRQFLHAYHLSFKHPITGQELTFTDELPRDLKKALDELSS